MKNFQNKARRKSLGGMSDTATLPPPVSDPLGGKAESPLKRPKHGRGLLGSKTLSRSMENLFRRGKGTKTYEINIDGGQNEDFPEVPIYTETYKPSRLSKGLSSQSSMPDFSALKRREGMGKLENDPTSNESSGAVNNTSSLGESKDNGSTKMRPKGSPPPVPPMGPATRRLRSRSLDLSQYTNHMILSAIDIDVNRNEQLTPERDYLAHDFTGDDDLNDHMEGCAGFKVYDSEIRDTNRSKFESDFSDDTSSVYSHSSSISTSIYSWGSSHYSSTADHVYGNLSKISESEHSKKANTFSDERLSVNSSGENMTFGVHENDNRNLSLASGENLLSNMQNGNDDNYVTPADKRKLFRDSHKSPNHVMGTTAPVTITEYTASCNQEQHGATGTLPATCSFGVSDQQDSRIKEPGAPQDALRADDGSPGMVTMAESLSENKVPSHEHVQLHCQNKKDNTNHSELTLPGQNGQVGDHRSASLDRGPGQLPGRTLEDNQHQTVAAAFNSIEDLGVHPVHDHSDKWESTHGDIKLSAQADLALTEVWEHDHKDDKEQCTLADGNYYRDTHRKESVTKDVVLRTGVSPSLRSESDRTILTKVKGVKEVSSVKPTLVSDTSQTAALRSKKLISRPSVPPPKAPLPEGKGKAKALAFGEESSVDGSADDLIALRETLLKFDIIIDDSEDQDQDDSFRNTNQDLSETELRKDQIRGDSERVTLDNHSQVGTKEVHVTSGINCEKPSVIEHRLLLSPEQRINKYNEEDNKAICTPYIENDEVRDGEPRIGADPANHVSPDLPPAATHKKDLFALEKNEEHVTHNIVLTPRNCDDRRPTNNNKSWTSIGRVLEPSPVQSELKHRLMNLKKTPVGSNSQRDLEEKEEASDLTRDNRGQCGLGVGNMVQRKLLPLPLPKKPNGLIDKLARLESNVLNKDKGEVESNSIQSSTELDNIYDDIGVAPKKALLPPNFSKKYVGRSQKEDFSYESKPVKQLVEGSTLRFATEDKARSNKVKSDGNVVCRPKPQVKPKPKIPPKSEETLRKFRLSIGSNSSDGGIASPTSPRSFSPLRGYSPSRSLSPQSPRDSVFQDFETTPGEIMETKSVTSPGGLRLSPGLNPTTAAYIKSSTPKGFTPSPNKSYKIHFHSPITKTPSHESSNSSKPLYTQVNKDKTRSHKMLDLSSNIKLSEYKSKLKQVKGKRENSNKVIKRRPTIPKKPKGVLNKLTSKSAQNLANIDKMQDAFEGAVVSSDGEDMSEETGDKVSLDVDVDEHGNMSGDVYDDTLSLKAHTSSAPASTKKTLFKKSSVDTSSSVRADEVLKCGSHANHNEGSPPGDTYDDVGYLGGIASDRDEIVSNQPFRSDSRTGKSASGVTEGDSRHTAGQIETPFCNETHVRPQHNADASKKKSAMKLEPFMPKSLSADNIQPSLTDSKRIESDLYEDIGSPRQPESSGKKTRTQYRYDEVCPSDDIYDDNSLGEDKGDQLGRSDKPRFMIVTKPLSTTHVNTGGYDPDGLYEELPEDVPSNTPSGKRVVKTSEENPGVSEEIQQVKFSSGSHANTPVARIPPFRRAAYDEVCMDENGSPVIFGLTDKDIKPDIGKDNNGPQKQNNALLKFASLMKQNKLNFSKFRKSGDSKDNTSPRINSSMSSPNLSGSLGKPTITYADLDKSYLNHQLDDRSSLGSNSESISSMDVELRERKFSHGMRMCKSQNMDDINDNFSQSFSSTDSISVHSGSDSAISEFNDSDQKMTLEDRRKQLARVNQKVHRSLGAKHLSKLYVANLKEKTATLREKTKEKTSNLKKIPKMFSKSATNISDHITTGARKSLGDLSVHMQRMMRREPRQRPAPQAPSRDYVSDFDDDGWSENEFDQDEDFYENNDDLRQNHIPVTSRPSSYLDNYVTPVADLGNDCDYIDCTEDQDAYEVPIANISSEQQLLSASARFNASRDDNYLTPPGDDSEGDYIEPEDDQSDYEVPNEEYNISRGHQPLSGQSLQHKQPPLPSRQSRHKSNKGDDGGDYLALIAPTEDRNQVGQRGPPTRRLPPPIPSHQVTHPHQFVLPAGRPPIQTPDSDDDEDAEDEDDYVEPTTGIVPHPPPSLPPRNTRDVQYPQQGSHDAMDEVYEEFDSPTPPPPMLSPRQIQKQQSTEAVSKQWTPPSGQSKLKKTPPPLPVKPSTGPKPKPTPPAKPVKTAKPVAAGIADKIGKLGSIQPPQGRAGPKPHHSPSNGFHSNSSDSEQSGSGEVGAFSALPKQALKPPSKAVPLQKPPRSFGQQITPATKPLTSRALPALPQNTNEITRNTSASSDDLDDLYSYHWYFGSMHRFAVEEKLRSAPTDGVFMVRKSNNGGEDRPYTLSLIYNQKYWNLHIRRREDRTYALGHFKPSEKTFPSVPDLVSYHQSKNLILAGSLGGETTLNGCPKKT